MKASSSKLRGTVAFALFSMLATTASAQVSTTANGPYYATPSWDQKLTTNRFVVLANWNNEAVLDRETGLVWERSPDATTRAWLVAKSHCIRLSAGGRKGWRLPGVQELASLVDESVASPGPTLPAGHPFLNVQSSFYWSASTLVGNTTGAWVVGFAAGDVTLGGQGATNYVWCVRGGQGPDAAQ